MLPAHHTVLPRIKPRSHMSTRTRIRFTAAALGIMLALGVGLSIAERSDAATRQPGQQVFKRYELPVQCKNRACDYILVGYARCEVSARRRWATFAGLWLASAVAFLFLLAIPFGNSPLMFWATWLAFALVTFFGGLVVTIVAGATSRTTGAASDARWVVGAGEATPGQFITVTPEEMQALLRERQR